MDKILDAANIRCPNRTWVPKPNLVSRRAKRIVAALALFVWHQAALGYNFTPTDSEWQGWPGYCKAKYTTTVIGSRSKFSRSATAAGLAEMAVWEKEGFRGIHHYCTGTIFIERSKSEANPDRKASMLRRAEGETLFSYQGTVPSSPKFPFIAVQLALVKVEQGKSDEALSVLRHTVLDHPANELLYSAMGVVLRKMGQTREAKKTLLAGFKATGEASAEISYNLGLISLELGQLQDAEKFAKIAYGMGFPLPGLQRKLARAQADSRSH